MVRHSLPIRQKSLSHASLQLVLLCLVTGLALVACHRTLSMAHSVDYVVRDLQRQLAHAAPGKRRLVIDPMLDSRSGQQTLASSVLQELLATELAARLPEVELVPFDAETVGHADLLLTGSLTPLAQPGQFRVSIALTDPKSGLVVAQSGGNFRDLGLDLSPTDFYADSPAMLLDRTLRGQLQTAETDRGEPADAVYMEQVPVAAVLNDAQRAYDSGQFRAALKLYSSVAELEDGQQIRTYNGLYLSNTKLGRGRDAARAFDKIVRLGLSQGNLSVKLLFRPGHTTFWPDARVSGVYPMWLEHIAGAARDSEACLHVIGHTSASGSHEVNQQLSLERASVIRDKLIRLAPSLSHKLRVSGVGSSENIVGTGKDDASDAIDRRVEFEVESCAAAAHARALAGAEPEPRELPGSAATTPVTVNEPAANRAPALRRPDCNIRKIDWQTLDELPGHGELTRMESLGDMQEGVDEVLYADLDGDSRTEAFVVVSTHYGANNGHTNIYAYELRADCSLGLLGQIGPLPGGCSAPSHIAIERGRFVVDVPLVDDSESRCFSTNAERREYTVKADQLVATGRSR